ncbi:MAG TPA: polysaccharide deacetylase family protein, partial [Vicinamibacteria bacterium]|nr:polysaccharide deacetylase family protein [Vicinamibacteria bacterium]
MKKGRRALAAALLGLTLLAATEARAQAPARSLPERLGYPAGARLLVLHGDDLGMSHSVNRATFEALEKGWISSASILVPCPWFPEVATWARAHPEADLGIHLALNSEWTSLRWRPLGAGAEVASLVDDQGYFPLVETTVAARAKGPEVERELRRQIDRARSAGIRLSHLDSHMGALFQNPALLAVYLDLGKTYGLPLLLQRSGDGGRDDALIDRVLSIEPGVPASGWMAAYQKMLEPLPPGAYQVIVHLAYDDEEMRGATSDHPD